MITDAAAPVDISISTKSLLGTASSLTRGAEAQRLSVERRIDKNSWLAEGGIAQPAWPVGTRTYPTVVTTLSFHANRVGARAERSETE